MSALTFDPVEHRYWFDGQPVPGVTSVLAPLYDFAGIPPEVLRAKAELGTSVHIACELDDEDDLVEESVHPAVQPYLQAWRNYRRDTGAVVIASEQRVFNPTHRYAGTLDRVVEVDGVRTMLDLKTSAEVHPAVGPQTAAYMAALGDVRITRRAALQLRPDATYRLVPLNDPGDFAVFVACLAIHRFKEKHHG